MQRVTQSNVDLRIRRALRVEICPICPRRPEESASQEATSARECEGTCPIFANLAALKLIAADGRGDPRARYEHAIRESICQGCYATPFAGDFCYEGFVRTCPLTLYGGRAITIIEWFLRAKGIAVAGHEARV